MATEQRTASTSTPDGNRPGSSRGAAGSGAQTPPAGTPADSDMGEPAGATGPASTVKAASLRAEKSSESQPTSAAPITNAGSPPGVGVAPARTAGSAATPGAAAGAPRTVRLSLARIDPWSAMKMTFLLSVALGIATVVAAFLLWTMVNGMGVLDSSNDFIRELTNASDFSIYDYVGLTRVLSLVTVLAVANVVLLTALGTLGAVLYNVSAALVGGIGTTLTDD